MSGRFGRIIQRENRRSARGSFGCGRRFPSKSLGCLLRYADSTLASGARAKALRRIYRFVLFFQSHNILIGNFPAEVLRLASLAKVLFQEYRTAGICHERAGSREQDVTGAVVHFHPAPEKRGITSHTVLSVRAR